MRTLRLACPFCGEVARPRPVSETGLAGLISLYLAHLVESHWDVLERAREQRQAAGVPVNDAWTRL